MEANASYWQLQSGCTQVVMPAGTAHQTHTKFPLSIQPCWETPSCTWILEQLWAIQI